MEASKRLTPSPTENGQGQRPMALGVKPPAGRCAPSADPGTRRIAPQRRDRPRDPRNGDPTTTVQTARFAAEGAGMGKPNRRPARPLTNRDRRGKTRARGEKAGEARAGIPGRSADT